MVAVESVNLADGVADGEVLEGVVAEDEEVEAEVVGEQKEGPRYVMRYVKPTMWPFWQSAALFCAIDFQFQEWSDCSSASRLPVIVLQPGSTALWRFSAVLCVFQRGRLSQLRAFCLQTSTCSGFSRVLSVSTVCRQQLAPPCTKTSLSIHMQVLVENHRHEGIFISRGKEDALVTKNMVPGESVYGEKRVSVEVRIPPTRCSCTRCCTVQQQAAIFHTKEHPSLPRDSS